MVRCPVCHAMPGQPCANEDSSPRTEAHAERFTSMLLGRPVIEVDDAPSAIAIFGRWSLREGCPCPCHRGQKGIRHIIACHPDGYDAPREYEVG